MFPIYWHVIDLDDKVYSQGHKVASCLEEAEHILDDEKYDAILHYMSRKWWSCIVFPDGSHKIATEVLK